MSIDVGVTKNAARPSAIVQSGKAPSAGFLIFVFAVVATEGSRSAAYKSKPDVRIAQPPQTRKRDSGHSLRKTPKVPHNPIVTA